MDKISDIIKQDPRKACEGCQKAMAYHVSGLMCPVYIDPSQAYPVRVFGVCPHNAPEVIVTAKEKQKIRVGQQKHKKHSSLIPKN